MTDDDVVKIFGNDIDALRILGNALASKTCNKIMQLLHDKEMYANQISKKLGIQLNLTLFHLNKLEEIGIVKVTYKTFVRNGAKHKHYKMTPNILISIFQTKKEIHETGFLRKIFRDGVKFASIGIAGITTWFISTFNSLDEWKSGEQHLNIIEMPPLVISLLVIIIGLVIERVYSITKKRVRNPIVVLKRHS